ncbi:MAG: pyruvate formate-lyase-activating protein [Firmicutes bacterium]|nr:pyruvate formate-lyase-activating protein [Bacillota bacterium]
MNLKISTIETLGAHDGPGLRTVLFLHGCPLKCLYCHNPEMTAFNKDKSSQVFASYSVQYLVDFCKKYKSYYGEGGGVTLSGGEPLVQSKAVYELIKALKKEGIHTCLDTSGGVALTDDVKNVLDEVDLVLLDIKHTDNEQHKKLAGQPLDKTLAVLEYMKSIRKDFIIRQVVVSGFTDNETQIKALKEIASGARTIELLPYHGMGAHKWEKLGIDYALKNVLPPSKELMVNLNKIL